MRQSQPGAEDETSRSVSVVRDVVQLIAHLIERVLDEVAVVRQMIVGQQASIDEILEIVRPGDEE